MPAQDQKPKWVQHFNVDAATWAELCAQALNNKGSPLEIAIDRGIINQESLLTWDRDTSKIPTLKIDFFNSEPPFELFQKFDYLKCREKSCMPVTEWNGNIYWAKLSSDPTGFEKENSQSFWFLTTWLGLKKWFAAWKATLPTAPQENISPIAKFIDLPRNSTAAPPPPEPGFEFGEIEPEASQSKSFTGTELNQVPSPPLELEVPGASGPEALTLDTPLEMEKPLRPETSSKAIDPKAFAPMQPHAEINLEESLQPIKMEDPVVKKTVKPIEAPTGLTDISKKVTAAIDFSSLLGAPPPPLPLHTSQQETVIDPPPVAPAVSASVVPAAPLKKIPTIALDQFESRMRLATSQDALAETFMGAWQNYFEQVMILLFQNNKLNIWWHNFQFKNQVSRGEVIPLDTPSAFKIVADTGHPYHGYVSQGPVNDHFFRVSNGGHYPEHLTIIPVKSDERVVAMLLGMCNKDAGKGIVLPKLEEDSRVFSNFLMRFTSPAKRAG